MPVTLSVSLSEAKSLNHTKQRFLAFATLRFVCACATLDSPPGLADAGEMTIPVFGHPATPEGAKKGDSRSRIGEHPWKKRYLNLVAQFALLLSTSPLALPGSPTSTLLSAGGGGKGKARLTRYSRIR